MMGCLIEGIFEFIFEVIGESILYGYLYLMKLILPEKFLNEKLKAVLKVIVIIFSVILLCCIFLGLIALLDEDTKEIGRYMVYIPLAISGVQILLGIILRIVAKKRK